MKVVSLVDPTTAINMSVGPEKVVVICNSGTVVLSGPTTNDLYKGKFGTRNGRIIGPVVKRNFSVFVLIDVLCSHFKKDLVVSCHHRATVIIYSKLLIDIQNSIV